MRRPLLLTWLPLALLLAEPLLSLGPRAQAGFLYTLDVGPAFSVGHDLGMAPSCTLELPGVESETPCPPSHQKGPLAWDGSSLVLVLGGRPGRSGPPSRSSDTSSGAQAGLFLPRGLPPPEPMAQPLGSLPSGRAVRRTSDIFHPPRA